MTTTRYDRMRDPYADPTMGVLAFYADRTRGEQP